MAGKFKKRKRKDRKSLKKKQAGQSRQSRKVEKGGGKRGKKKHVKRRGSKTITVGAEAEKQGKEEDMGERISKG